VAGDYLRELEVYWQSLELLENSNAGLFRIQTLIKSLAILSE